MHAYRLALPIVYKMRIHKPSHSELNPPETPWQKLMHRCLYLIAYPLLKLHLKFWYGFSLRYNFDVVNPDHYSAPVSGPRAPNALCTTMAEDFRDSKAATHNTCSSFATSTFAFPKKVATDAIISAPYKKWRAWKARRELKHFRSSLVICNHVALLDSPMAAVALWPLHLQFLSLAENGQHKIYSPLVRAFGTVFVGKNLVDVRAMLSRQRQALEEGDCVLLFPEGALQPYATQTLPFKEGAFRLAHIYRVPMLCLTLVPEKKVCLNRLLGRPGFTAYVGPVLQRAKEGSKAERIERLCGLAQGILDDNLRRNLPVG